MTLATCRIEINELLLLPRAYGFEVFLASYRGMAEHTGVSVGPTVGRESGPGFIVHYIAYYWLVA
jgi:hypothetical protein